MTIEFKPIERDCRHNERVKTKGTDFCGRPTTRLLIDYAIVIDGEKRAEFRMCDLDRKGFYMVLLTGSTPSISPVGHKYRKTYMGNARIYKTEFEMVVEGALARGQIPSVADQMKWKAEHDRIQAEKNDAAWAKYCVDVRKHRMGEKGDELLALLDSVDQFSEASWHKWLGKRDSLVAYIQEPPPKDEAHMLAAGIRN